MNDAARLLLERMAVFRAMASLAAEHHVRAGDWLVRTGQCALVGCSALAAAHVPLPTGHWAWLCEGHGVDVVCGQPLWPWAPC